MYTYIYARANRGCIHVCKGTPGCYEPLLLMMHRLVNIVSRRKVYEVDSVYDKMFFGPSLALVWTGILLLCARLSFFFVFCSRLISAGSDSTPFCFYLSRNFRWMSYCYRVSCYSLYPSYCLLLLLILVFVLCMRQN